MINELKAMAIFAEVIKSGSFRQAAKVLNLSPSVISYHISQLEQKTGSALIYRSTRKLTLSDEGERFYLQVLNMLNAAEVGMSLLANTQRLRGKIKVSLPTALSRSHLNKHISRFIQEYPNVEVELEFSDSRQHLIENRIDLAIRAGELPDSDMKTTALGRLKRVMVCTPELFKQHPTPNSPTDLVTWPWIKLTQLPPTRQFTNGKASQTINFSYQLAVNSVEAIHQFCLNGSGLAVLAEEQVAEDITNGKLIKVLEDWQVEPLPLHALWPKNLPDSSPAKRLMSMIKAQIG